MRIVFMRVHAEEHCILGAMRAGARGCLVKPEDIADLAEAVRAVAAGGVYLGRSVAHLFTADRPQSGRNALTVRDRPMLQLLAEGKTGQATARVLGVSVKTARAYRSRLMEKLRIDTIAGLVRYAVRERIVQPVLAIIIGLF